MECTTMVGLFLLEDDYNDEEEKKKNEDEIKTKKDEEKKKKEILSHVGPTDSKQSIGGIGSYIRRNLPFIKEDERIFAQIQKSLEGIRTEGEKVALLKKIDNVMANSSGSGEITWKDVAIAAGLIAATGGVLGGGLYAAFVLNIGKWLWGKTDNRQEFLDRMRSVRAAVANYPINKYTKASSTASYTR